MMKNLLLKIKEALVSVLPVTLIVLILNFTPLVNFSTKEIICFSISALLLIIGIGLFNLGADVAMTPMGEQVGSGLTKSKSLKILLVVCFALGLFITIAEPDLSVLASQVSEVINGTLLIVCVGVGVGLFLLISVLKIVFKRQLATLLMFFYMLLFALALLVVINGNADFLPLAFDSGGVTTGPITVPFIMALGVGIAATIGGKHSNENSFGLIALCSVGPILAVMLLGVFADGTIDYVDPNYQIADNFALALLHALWDTVKEVTLALGLVVLFFFIINFIFLKLPKRKLKQIGIGIVFTFIGLVIFLAAVNVGYVNGEIVINPTQEQREIMQGIADECYKQFVGIVSTQRKLPSEKVLELADGRIYTAYQALQNGLIDKIDSWENMIEDLRDDLQNPECKVKTFQVIQKQTFLDKLLTLQSEANNTKIAAQIGIPLSVYKELSDPIPYPAYLYK